ncbi:MAG: glycosyl hydrolase [Bacteroidota bacterium]
MKHFFRFVLPFILMFLVALPLHAQDEDEKADETGKKKELNSAILSGLKFRNIGPALPSGRIIDFAVNPRNTAEYYVAVACGGVWKTSNDGISFSPVFEKEASFSIGCVTLDPNNPFVVWVGSGENNSQRSVSWGDGIYRSADGGKSWKNMGLKKSEHIGKIVVDPTDSRVVYVAAQGPLWGPGGDRGLYKTTDAGATWKPVLTISENTGVTDVVMDPRDANVLYAASYQRRRHVWTLINGGPESKIFKSTDGGASWDTLSSGLPSGNVGRIGLALSPANPDYIYAIIEASEDKGGVFRSTDRGASWERRGEYMTVSPQYYNELVCDPLDAEKVYSLDTYTRVSTDGFKTNRSLGNRKRHVDDHALWIDPSNTKHILIGGDGGVYESYDGGEQWRYKENLPVTQFYRVAVDNAEPFYFVYGGTQDNNSLGGPSRTTKADGIFNEDWFFTNGGDGFESQIDPVNPNIVYAQSQYGGLIRFDKASGEQLSIQPLPAPGEEGYRWNWDAPLLISPHKNTRLYFAANKLFRSEDRGESWTVISPDLSRQIDRNTLPVMGQVWDAEAVAKNASTSLYGNIVSFDESPLTEGLLYVGTDDGLIQVSEDAGTNWRKIERIAGVPDMTYVSCLKASMHDANTVYACFDNHKMADFKPYVMKSGDRGKTWTSIAANLPEAQPVYTIAEDFKKATLLFVGTEYGIHTSVDGGKKWVPMKSGLPTIAVKDIAIQQRESDLVLATFGRGFYVLDDYSPLRDIDASAIEKDAAIFPVRDALMYNQSHQRAVGNQGETFFATPNPDFGAVFTYYIKDDYKSLKQQRQEAEKKLRKEKKTPPYPGWDALRAEEDETAPMLVFTIRDNEGNVVRRLTEGVKSGLQRTNWDLRYTSTAPVGKGSKTNDHSAMLAMPGQYTVTLTKVDAAVETPLAGPVTFTARVLENTTLPTKNRSALAAFHKRVMEVQRVGIAAQRYAGELNERLLVIEKTMLVTPRLDPALRGQWTSLRDRLRVIDRTLNGDKVISRRDGLQPPSVMDRLGEVAWGQWRSSSGPTPQHSKEIELAAEQLRPLLVQLRGMGELEIPALEKALEQQDAPYIPGRLPELR